MTPCSLGGRGRACGVIVGAALVAIAAAGITGCATPRGVLFPPLDQPRVWPSPPDPARITLLGVISSSDDLAAARSGFEAVKVAFRGPRPPIRFTGPHALAIRGRDLVAVADGAGGAVHLIDLGERTHRIVTGWQGSSSAEQRGSLHSEEERFGAPVGVAWVGDRLFVTDAERHEVIELDDTGRFKGRFGRDALTRPVGIAYVPQRDQLYVVDGGAHCIKVFDPSGSIVKTLGRRGTAPGAFNYPSHIAVWHCSVAVANERLVVADSGNFRIQLLDLDGICLKTIGQKGDGAGDFALPKGVAFDREGNVYVVDAQFENVQVFDPQGRLLLAIGEEGREPGQFWLPAGVAIDQVDRIWVADSGNRRLQVFEQVSKRQNVETSKRRNRKTRTSS